MDNPSFSKCVLCFISVTVSVLWLLRHRTTCTGLYLSMYMSHVTQVSQGACQVHLGLPRCQLGAWPGEKNQHWMKLREEASL